MSTAFRTLSLGVGSFDKSKSSFHDVFKPSGSSSSKDAAVPAETQPQAVAASLPAELDFFASSSGSSGKKASATSSSSAVSATAAAKKRKRPTSSSSSSAPTPTPTPLTPATLNPFLRQHRIKITVGADNSSNHVDYPLPLVSWSEASARHSVPTWLIDELQSERGWDLTPIQRAALPVALEGRDLLAMAPTGSGKTLAYLVPLLHKLMRQSSKKEGEESQDKGRAPRAVILSPTRELATQIFDETRRLLRARPEEDYASHDVKKGKKGKKPTSVPTEGGLRISLLTGGDKIRAISEEDAKNLPTTSPPLDLIIATPLRLQQAITQESYTLSSVHSIVLDEADTLLGSSSAFLPQVDSLLSLCTRPPHLGGVQKSLFTATLPSSVETLARSLLAPDHVRLIVGRNDSSSSDVDQALKFVGSEEGKLLELRGMVKRGEVTPPALLFVQSIERAKDLLEELAYDGLRVDAIHSDRSRKEREAVLRSFKQGKVWLLICTEVMARGLDFKGVDLVINYDLPTSTESYVHRVGRTGRAGRRGKAVSFWTKEDAPYLRSILNLIKQSGGGEVEELVPRYLLEGGAAAAAAAAAGKGGKGGAKSKAAAKRERKKLKTKPVERQAINEASGSRKLDEDRRERREGKRLRPKKGRGEQEGSSDDDSGSDDD